MGCKAETLEDSISNLLSFTLTMWDVKCSNGITDKTISFSFTLTMWDVKIIHF